MDWYLYPAVVFAGFAAGFINTLAGSGSLVTLPLLIFLGLPANVANGTNRVAVLLQNVAGSASFRHSKMMDLSGALMLGIPATLGSVGGAQIAANLNELLMRRAIGAVMLAMLIVLLVRPERWLQGTLTHIERRPTWLQMGAFFVIGIYGGFIQAGVGIFLLAALVLAVGYDLVRANAVKVGIILLFTVAALAVFVRNGQVNWEIGLILATGNVVGALVATRVAIKSGAEWVRRLLMAVVIIAAAHLLGIFTLVRQLF